MVIHIKGGTLSNRGDELMLRTINEKLQSFLPSAQICVSNYYAPYSIKSELGLFQTLWDKSLTLQGTIGYYILKRYAKSFGIIPPNKISWILDISGFCYTDEWDLRNITDMLTFVKRQNKYGSNLIFMPQAFGPFNSKESRNSFKELASFAEIIFPRDSISRDYLLDLNIEPSKIVKAPDITTIGPSFVPEEFNNLDKKFICLVPNSRILEKRGENDFKAYIKLFINSIDLINEKGFYPVILLFDEYDKKIVKTIKEKTSSKFLFYNEFNPIHSRGIIGKSHALIGSRYHSLVSGLSQGVPSLGTSWSHKYQELFRDYNCEKNLISDFENGIETINRFLHQDNIEADRDNLKITSKKVIQSSYEMWELINTKMKLNSSLEMGSDEIFQKKLIKY